MTTTTSASETWQARITPDLAAQLRSDAELLGFDGRTEIVRAALELLHRRAAEERMARSVDSFYEDIEPTSAGRRPASPTHSPARCHFLNRARRGVDVDFGGLGVPPGVVLSINALNTRLGHVAVIPVTSTSGPEYTHIPLTANAGPARYEESYADVTALQPVARSRFLKHRGLLTRVEMAHVGRQLTVYLAL